MSVVPPTKAELRAEAVSVRYFGTDTVYAVNDISISLRRGEVLALVGESGSGKSTLIKAILRILQPPAKVVSGSVHLGDENLLTMRPGRFRRLRGASISMVSQDPMTALNPVLTIGAQLTDVMHAHMDLSKREAKSRAVDLLRAVGIKNAEDRFGAYPHELSGGMRQRVAIAIAISCDPDFVIADEPTSALDVTIQKQVMDLLMSLRERLDMGIILVTHDLRLVRDYADRVAVMYAGYVVETGPTRQVLDHPAHPYTRALQGAIPSLTEPVTGYLPAIEGQSVTLKEPARACPFADRCEFAIAVCREQNPPLESVEPGHQSACWRSNELREAWSHDTA